jgi:hypothetical protein
LAYFGALDTVSKLEASGQFFTWWRDMDWYASRFGRTMLSRSELVGRRRLSPAPGSLRDFGAQARFGQYGEAGR